MMTSVQKKNKGKFAVLAALAKGKQFKPIVAAGRKTRDQLFRALVPLYMENSIKHVGGLTSGDVERFWRSQRVKFLAPNVARTWREQVGYSRRTINGPEITPNGIKYVVDTVVR